MIRKRSFILYLLAGLILSTACQPQVPPTAQPNLPNPASVYCEQNGGKLELRQDASGGTAGMCVFPDGSECDEWAYFRGECSPVDSNPKPTESQTASTAENTRETMLGGIVFYSNRGNGYNNVYLLDLGSSMLKQITQGENNAFSGPFSPDGSQLLFTGFGLTHSYVGWMNADGSNPVDLTNKPDSDEAFPTWSPDGNWVAFTSRRDGNNEIYVMNADGSEPKRLTDSPKDDFAPAWSPDGQRIAFVSDRDNQTGVYSLYLMNADGTGVVCLTKDQSSDTSPAWSPDGAQIVYQSVRDGQANISLINSDGSGPVNLTQNQTDDGAPQWSPDGSQIAFHTDRDGDWEIYVMNVDGSNPVNISNNPADDQAPYWRP